MADYDEENNAGGVDPILAVLLGGIFSGIAWVWGKLCGKQEAEAEKNEALKAKDEEIKALQEKIDEFIKAYDEQKLENSELLKMCERLLAEIESDRKLPSNYKGELIAQLKKRRSRLLRSSAA